jgi:S-DNA-T family DNA segregation ATPase FtsK/SpoIIIE
MLVSLITRSLILGVVGEAIFRFWMGLFGCCAYPILVLLILFGVMLIKNLKFNFKKKYLAATIIVAFCVLQTLQVATTTSFIGVVTYGDYLTKLYWMDNTAGGLVAGLTAWPVSKIFSPIGSYLLYLVVSLVTLFFTSSFGTALFEKKREEALKKRIAAESGANDVKSPGLFVYSFESAARAVQNASHNFDEGNKPAEYNEYSQPDDFTKSQNDKFWDELVRRRNAQKALFEENDVALERFKPQRERDEYKSEILRSRSQYVSPYGGFDSVQPDESSCEQPQTESQIQKDESRFFSSGIPGKDIESRFVAGEIINGDARSAEMSSSANTSTNNSFASAKSYKPVPFSPLPEQNNNFDYSTLPPITNGDRYTEKPDTPANEPVRKPVEETKPEPKPEQTDSQRSSLNTREQIGMSFDRYTTIPPIMPGPIINADTYKSADEYEVAPQTMIINSELTAKNNDTPRLTEQVKDEFEPSQSKFDENFESEEPTAPVMAAEERVDSCDDYEEIDDDKANDLFDIDSSQDSDDDYSGGDIVTDPDDIDFSDESFDKEDYDESDSADDVVNEEDEIENDAEDVEDDFDEVDDTETLPSADEIELIKQRERENAFVNSTRSFVIDDEVEDRTTIGSQSSQAISDYYSNLSPTSQNKPQSTEYVPFSAANEPKKTVDIKKDQITIDDYAAGKAKKELEEVEKVEEKPVKKVLRPYERPLYSLLTTETEVIGMSKEEEQEKTEVLEECLESLSIPAKVVNITEGPAVTRYELEMPQGIRVSKIEQVAPDIQYSLMCEGNIRIQTPIPGKRAIGIEVPKKKPAIVGLKDVIESPEFQNSTSPLTVAIGKDVAGNNIVTRLDKLPHLLIAGTTGSGKSACLNSLIVSLIYKASPTDVKIILVDPKRVEFTPYIGIPHLLIKEPINEVKQAIKAFAWVRNEMNRRYTLLQAARVRNITEYNAMPDVKDGKVDKLPFIVFIVDEYADLMVSSSGSGDQKRVLEEHIQSITQKARAAGIHLILATQRPSADVITGTIKANLPSKIAFKVSSRVNSSVILDRNGAEALVGRGDMLFLDASSTDPIRVQGAFIDDDEIRKVVDFCRDNNDTDFSEEFSKAIKEEEKKEEPEFDESDDVSEGEEGALGSKYDKDIEAVARMVLKTHNASGAMIQRRFSMGYVRAVKIVDQLEELGFISPLSPSNKREVLLTEERFKEVFGHYPDEDL